MNSKSILLAATLAGGLLSSAVVSSAAVVLSDLTVSSTEYVAPVPVRVVSPTGIWRRYQGETIRVSLTIDETGQPRNVDLLSGRDPHLVRRLLPVVAQWHFTPAMKNGRAVPADIVLPIQLVEGPNQ